MCFLYSKYIRLLHLTVGSSNIRIKYNFSFKLTRYTYNVSTIKNKRHVIKSKSD